MLFAGGATLVDDRGGRTDVQKLSDIKRWLQKVPELNLIAGIDAQFLFAGDALDVQPVWWENISKTIAKLFSSADGFIITQPVSTLSFTAAALSFLLRGVGKPVVLTGGIDAERTVKRNASTPATGIRANLVNAMQVATADLGEVVVMFGSRVLRGSCVVQQTEPGATVFDNAGASLLGRVDFGLKLETHRNPRTNKAPRLALGMKTNVLQITYAPGVTSIPTATDAKLDGVFVANTPLAGVPSQLLSYLEKISSRGVPVVLHSEGKRKRLDPFLTATRMTTTAAYVKFLWALGQTTSQRALQKLLDTDIAGEHIES